jgi:hypothetical protein
MADFKLRCRGLVGAAQRSSDGQRRTADNQKAKVPEVSQNSNTMDRTE